MNFSIDDKYNLIKNKILISKSKNPIEIANSVMEEEYIDPNGPEHHFIAGASFLMAYHNLVNEFDINKHIEEFANRAKIMPGGSCGKWGVCCSVTSLGAAFSIIHGTSPLSSDDFYKDNMEFTSETIGAMSKIGGPRCCKRNVYISISKAINYFERKYNIKLEKITTKCQFYEQNKECIKESCPYYYNEQEATKWEK